MADRKKNILWDTEATFLATGFSTLSYEILKRLHKNRPDFSITEIGSYANSSDPKALDLPWKFYGAIPDPRDEILTRRFNGSPYGQFGEAMFEKVLLDEQIQCVIGCRDFWMCVASGDVWLAGGEIKPVSEAKVGDEVLTHNNRFRKITKVGNRIHNGKFVEILTDRVCFPVELTDNHPILRIPNRLKIYRNIPQESHFVEASEIRKNDHLVFPIPVFEEEKVSFNDEEIAHISFTKEFGENEIPRWVFHLPMRQRYIFLQNLLRSKGYYSREKQLAKYNTTSKYFAKQLWTLILSMRIDSCVKETRKINKKGKHYFTYTVQISKREFHRIEEIYREGEINRPSLSSRIYGDYLVLCVKNIKQSEGSKTVYNLQVEEDETFTCGFATHNCSEWQMKSPFRDKFKYIYMPTMDGSPQKSIWTHGYSEADLLLSQADYGRDLLENHGYAKLKVFGTVNPGVDPEVFKPIENKKELRKKAGIPENAKIIVSLMRNQKRKLFPDILDMFNEYIRYCVDHDNKDLAENTYLYWHTSYPDVGFDLGRLILESGLGHRVLLTYTCGRCKCFYPDFFQSEVSVCRQCGAPALHMPNTQHGISREDLALVYNLGDCLLQYSVAEGFGMSLPEAKACGLPVFATDYSAMQSHLNFYGGFPIKVEKFFYEGCMETEQRRALPDNTDCVKKLYGYFTAPEASKKKMSEEARKDAVENHSYDRAAKIFEQAIDSLELYDHKDTWLNPKPNFLQMPDRMPNFQSNGELVDFLIANVLKRPHYLNSPWRSLLVKSLNVGYLVGKQGFSKEQFTSDKIIQMFANMVSEHNYWETQRLSKIDTKDRKNAIAWKVV